MGCKSCGQAKADMVRRMQRNPNPSAVGVPANPQGSRVEFFFETDDGEQSFDRLSEAKRASGGERIRTRRVR